MAVDVVVINYRTPEDLEAFCQSYQEHQFDGCTLTVVHVDPVQPVWSEEIKQGVNHQALVVWENCGYGKACNIGAAERHNDVILLANADTLLTEGLIDCYKALIDNPSWGVLGPRQVNMQNQITAGGTFGTERAPQLRGWHEHDVGQFNDIRDDALMVSGALFFIKRSLWEELTECSFYQQYQPGVEGAFLETPHYFEDTFCSYHARAHGYKCVYYGPVQMIHHWHRASAHGGTADMYFARSQQMHREACATHGIISE